MVANKTPLSFSHINSISRFRSVILTILAGIAFAIMVFFAMRSMENQKIQLELEHTAQSFFHALKKSVDLNIAVIESLRAYYLASEKVHRYEFKIFAKHLLQRHSSIKALEWIPRVPGSQRAAYEQSAQSDGFHNFEITERNSKGAMVSSGQREEYFPVYFVEPYEGNEPALGYDLSSDTTRAEALNQARDSNTALATARIKLVQAPKDDFAFLIFSPLYQKNSPVDTIDDRRQNFIGFVLGVFRIYDIVEKALVNRALENIEILLYDLSAPAPKKFLFFHSPGKGYNPSLPSPSIEQIQLRSDFQVNSEYDVAGRKWLSQCMAKPDFITSRRTWQPWVSLFFILISFGLLASYFFIDISRAGQLAINYRKLQIEIEERKKAEEALRESEEKYRNLFNNAQIGMFRSRISDGKILEVNTKAAQIYGYDSPEECLDDYVASEHYIDPDIRQQMLKTLKKDGVINNAEAQLTRKDGSLYWGRFSSRMYPEKGYLEGVLTDISEEKLTQDALKEAYDIINRSPAVAFLWKNFEGLPVEYVSENVKELFGYTTKEFVTGEISYMNTIHPDDLDRVGSEVATCSAEEGREDFVHKPYRIVTKQGKTKWIDGMTFIRRDEKGEITHYEGIVLDVSERVKTEGEKERLQAQLQQSQKMESIGTLAGGIAHDFNNILSSIIGYTELALYDVVKETPLKDNLQEVYTAGKRARDLVQQILAFARQVDHEKKPIQLDTIVVEALKLIRSTSPTTIEIKQNLKSNSPILGNSTQIHQIIMNLCTNSVQAIEDTGGILEVGLKDVEIDDEFFPTQFDLDPGNYLKVTISDTGPGIASDIIDSIFEPYFTTKGAGKGTGMGLATVHGIVETHGGKISVDTDLGEGTVFSIYFPITQKREAYLPYSEVKLPSGKERILFVDDELSIAKMGGQMLERLGYQVTVRTSSIEALELFRSKPNDFDLVITDMTMPNMTGDELAKELMALRSDIPVILCTGYSKKINSEFAAGIGIRAFAYKPLVMADLAETVRRLLDAAKNKSEG